MDSLDSKIRLFFWFSCVVFTTILIRLFWIQIIDYPDWKERANKQHIVKKRIIRKRGSILDRAGNVLAYTAAVKHLICDPKRLKDPETTLSLLGTFTRLQIHSILPKLKIAGKKGRRYFLIKNDVTMEEFHKIQDRIEKEKKILGVPEKVGILANCIFFRDATRRYYPYNMIASNLLGFVGKDGRGLEGTELFYEDILRGDDGVKFYERGLNGRVIPNSETVITTPEGGTSIYLTIDVVIQYLVEKKLREAFEFHRPKNAVIVVMDPRNGELLAMASQPSYNPNYFRYYSQEDYKNRAVSDQFEPGSTLKVVTLAAALESHAITVEDIFSCVGYTELYDVFRIHCDGRKSHGDLNPSLVLKKSCNVGAIQIAQRVGTRRLYDYLRRFGFGERTGIQLPGEIRGVNRPPVKWSGLSLAALSIGQEIAVNTVQLVRAFSSIVNGGLLYHPKILLRTRSFGGEMENIESMPLRRVISRKTSKVLVKMLKGVTEPGGSGRRASIEGYEVLGKTGTAQSLAEMHKATSVWDAGSNPKVVASFVGAMPANDPRLVIYVMINEPQGEKYYGGQVAAPVFKELGKEILAYLKIPPSQKESPSKKGRKGVPTPDLIRRESLENSVPGGFDPEAISETGLEDLFTPESNNTIPDWINLSQDQAPARKYRTRLKTLGFSQDSLQISNQGDSVALARPEGDLGP